jgi:ParB-like chromosome segregation protein Spo0J
MINTKKVKLDLIKLNPNNPRLIKDDKFKKLVQSIVDFPQMLEIRPIVVNTDMIILGGNMRYKACKEAGIKEIPVIIADNLTEEQQKEFLIKDNVSGGEWNWELLANEWDAEELESWGLDIPNFAPDVDYSEKNKEIDPDFLDQKYTFKLEYTEEEYSELKSLIESKGQTPEQIFYEALTTL